ncbi:MAG: hypothetical protein LBQ15_03390 [Clostridium sp.]|jgi:dipicolinate synthase subunit A|nr:hypothetical protein [Clostridium sp.]
MPQTAIGVIGADTRQDYLARYLAERGFTVCRREEFSPEILEEVQLLIGPVTFYKNGQLIREIAEACKRDTLRQSAEKGTVLNYMACEDFLLRNAALTAEGFLSILIASTPFSLEEARILLLGLGRCGKALESVLERFPCRVTASDQIPEKISPEEAYNVVVNTIPAQVIKREHLNSLPKDCILFDLASAPGGYDREAVKELGLSFFHCPGIPGKMSPQSAGYAIGRCAVRYLEDRTVTLEAAEITA